MIGRSLTVLAVVMIIGCGNDLAPVPPQIAVQQADATAANDGVLHVRLVRSFEAAPQAAIERLSDANERIALAASMAAGRAGVRKDAAAAQRMLDSLGTSCMAERRPAVLAVQVESIVNLLANRPLGLEDSHALTALHQVAANPVAELAGAKSMAEAFLRVSADYRPPRLGGNVFDGPGWKVPRPKPAPALRPVAPYREPIHTVPIVAAGELHLGDVDGDGKLDYLIADAVGALQVRLTLYGHDGQMIWSRPLPGDERPVLFPPGNLPDLDGDGRAEIVYVDRAGRIVVADAAGNVVRRSEQFRTLDGEAYFGDRMAAMPATQPDAQPRPAAARLFLANLRGAGRRDLLLVSGPNLLAITEKFQTLWHVSLNHVAPLSPTLLCDLDGVDEVINGNVALDHAGRVLWTWPHHVIDATVGDFASGPGRIVVLTDGDRVAGFDAAGQLWQVGSPSPVRHLASGRFVPAGRAVGLTASSTRASAALNGLGVADLSGM
ncbi:MAG: VCBS repeat-containing protein, partial [Phycisphaerae bacterium]|nr:VCBS repeat-containing protein [Phycisphaerae bacterium]